MKNRQTRKSVVFVYDYLFNTGLSSKAKKIEDGFSAKGYDVNPLYYTNEKNKLIRFKSLIYLQFSYMWLIFTRRHEAIYIRYSYYYIFMFFISLVSGRHIQIEINGNIQEELVKEGQKIRAIIDRLALWLAVKGSTKVHVSSKELSERYQQQYPEATVVFTPNFVVDEYYDKQEHEKKSDKVNLVFLGDTEQKWHGLYEFIETIVAGQPWFAANCCLHIVGRCSDDIEKLLQANALKNIVIKHGFLSGETKHQVLAKMDIGISSFMLRVKGIKETTGIKTGEYLYSGLAIILGYVDRTAPPDLPFVLSINIDDPKISIEKVRTFVSFYKQTPELSEQAHEYAKRTLLVDNYINNIIK